MSKRKWPGSAESLLLCSNCKNVISRDARVISAKTVPSDINDGEWAFCVRKVSATCWGGYFMKRAAQQVFVGLFN